MSNFFKSPLSTPGLANSLFGQNSPGANAAITAFSPPPPPPAAAMLMPAAPAAAKVGYTQDDPRWQQLQKAGSSDTILTAPAYGGTKLGGDYNLDKAPPGYRSVAVP